MGEGTVLEKLQVIISASTKPLQDGLKKVNNAVNKTSANVDKQTNSIGNAFKKVGKVVAAAVSVAAIVSFGKSCVALGSDLSEVQNVVDVTFGSMSEDVNKFSKNAITQFGLSETSAKRYSSTMGAMLKSMGLTSDAVLDMSKNMTGLAGDIASFYNLSSDEAFSKIRSGISGETEPLKQLGINLSVANLEAYALSEGMTKSYSAMTQAEQATLRYNYLLKVTSDAQGDFARTSDSWANQTRILSERFNSIKASIGQGLINVFTPVLRVINQFINRLSVASQMFQSFTEKIFGKSRSSSSGGISSELTDAASSTDNIATSMGDTAKSAQKAKGALAGFDKINNISSGSDSSSGSGSTDTGTSGSADLFGSESSDSAVSKISASSNKIKSIMASIIKFATTNFGKTFKKIFKDGKNNFNALKKNITKVWEDLGKLKAPVKQWFNNDYVPYMNAWFEYLGTELNSAFTIFNTVFSSMWDDFVYPVLSNFITVGLPLITQFATASLGSLTLWKQNVTSIFVMLWQQGVSPALQSLAGVWTDTVNILAEAWNTYGGPIFDGINEAIENTAYVFSHTWETMIKPVWDIFIDVLNEVWEKHMKPYVKNLVSFAAEFADCALTIYNKFIAPLVTWIVDKLAPVFINTFGNILKFVGATIGNMMDFFSGIITSLRGVIAFIKGVFTGDWSLAWEGVKGIFKGIWDSFEALAKGPINLIITAINTFINGAESAINALIGALNKINVKIPDWVPGKYGGKEYGVNIATVDFGNINYLARGGIVSSPTNAIIGEAGKEAVIPLENNTGWMDKMASYISSKMDSSGIITAINSLSNKLGDGNIYLTAEMDGDIVYRSVVKRNKQFVKQTGRSEFAY